jgi:hypothetical protein
MAMATQVLRNRSGTSGGRRILRISDRVASAISMPGNELYLAFIGILLLALVVMTILTVREYILWKRR